MPCYTPIEAWQLEGGNIVFAERGRVLRALRLRCGNCVGCLIDRKKQWAARIIHESQMHLHNWFVTFTYNSEHLPADGALHYEDFQGFLHRLRRAVNYHRAKGSPRISVRHFTAGEYGGKYGRPHFHSILFNLLLPDICRAGRSPAGHTLWGSAWLEKLWGLGYITIGSVSFDSAAYTASYICKKIDPATEPLREFVDCKTGEVRKLPPEFARMSLRPAIGKTWFDKYHADCLPRDYCVVNGRKVPVPRYYTSLFKKLDAEQHEALEFERTQKSDSSALERTPERMATRELVALAGVKAKIRKL